MGRAGAVGHDADVFLPVEAEVEEDAEVAHLMTI